MLIKNDKHEFEIDQYEMNILGIKSVDDLVSAVEKLTMEVPSLKIGFKGEEK